MFCKNEQNERVDKTIPTPRLQSDTRQFEGECWEKPKQARNAHALVRRFRYVHVITAP